MNGDVLSAPIDIRLVTTNVFPAYSVVLDWQLLADGTLDDTMALQTAVAVALGTNALAGPDDDLPDPDSTDRQGWWGDLDAAAIWGAWPIGSKLWLLRRHAILPQGSKIGATQVWINTYITNALQPFVDNHICSAFEVANIRADKQRIDALIRMYRGPKPAIELKYQALWQGIVP
jgi:phage gp46-like protein